MPTLPSTRPPAPDPEPMGRWRAPLLVVLIGLMLQGLALFFNVGAGPKDFDEPTFHLPVLRQFMQQWPTPDVADYPAAAAPGYHLLMSAALAPLGPAVLDDHLVPVRWGSGLFTIALAGAVAWFCASRVRTVDAALIALTVLCGQYVLTSSYRLMPEGLAWLTVALGMGIAVSRLRWGVALGLGALVALGAVAVRQPSLWLCSCVWLAAWLGPASRDTTRAGHLVPPREAWSTGPRAARAGLALLATLPAFALLAWFVAIWGGMTPPTFQDREGTDAVAGATAHVGINPAVPVAMLMTLGVYGAPALLAAVGSPREALSARVATGAAVGGASGVLLALLVPTSYSQAGGRWGSLWNLARLVPDLGDRAPLVVLAAGVGGAAVAVLFAVLDARSRWVFLGALVAFTAAQTANTQAWIRYLEPFALIWLALATTQAVRTRSGARASLGRWARLAWLGLLALLLAQTLVFRVLDPRPPTFPERAPDARADHDPAPGGVADDAGPLTAPNAG